MYEEIEQCRAKVDKSGKKEGIRRKMETLVNYSSVRVIDLLLVDVSGSHVIRISAAEVLVGAWCSEGQEAEPPLDTDVFTIHY